MAKLDMNDIRRRMDGAIDSMNKDLSGLRTGRASVNMLEPVIVDVYGAKMPINQIGTVSTPEARLLTVNVWDASSVASVEKAIRDSGLGLNPMTEGSVIRVPVPELNEERRTELTKVAGKYAEGSRISIRNVRRDGMDSIKAMKNDGDISEDDQKRMEGDVQKVTDEFIQKIDKILVEKEADIMTV